MLVHGQLPLVFVEFIMLSTQIGEKIKILRRQKGISQQELAERIGVTWEMISRYERGKSSPLQKLEEISNALQIEMKFFFDVINDKASTLSSVSVEYGAPLLVPVLSALPKDPREMHTSFDSAMMFFSPPYPLFAKGIASSTMFALSLPMDTVEIEKSLNLTEGYIVCKLVAQETIKEYGDLPALYFSEFGYAIKSFKKIYKEKLVAIITAWIKVY